MSERSSYHIETFRVVKPPTSEAVMKLVLENLFTPDGAPLVLKSERQVPPPTEVSVNLRIRNFTIQEEAATVGGTDSIHGSSLMLQLDLSGDQSTPASAGWIVPSPGTDTDETV